MKIKESKTHGIVINNYNNDKGNIILNIIMKKKI